MVVSFTGGVEADTYFFQQVGLDFGSLEDTGAVEAEFDEFTKTGRVVYWNLGVMETVKEDS